MKQKKNTALVEDSSTHLFMRLKELIDSHQKFIITTHIVPDGDGLGGEMALAAYLKSLGKECWIINADPTPEKFSLVDPQGTIQIWKPGEKIPEAEMVLGVDVNEEERIGFLMQAFRKNKMPLIFIDHHLAEESFKAQHIIDESLSSMGEFFYRFFRYVHTEITFEIALALYVSITTDTKQFRHKKTSSLSHIIAAALVEIGVNPEEVHHHMRQSRSLAEMRLLGEALQDIKISTNKKIAWITLPLMLQKKYEATPEDTQGFVDFLMSLKEVEIGLVFREQNDGQVKISFRSKGKIPVYPLAKKWGGGGHSFEAGVCVTGTLQEVQMKILKWMEQELSI